jgi:serine O-acetyltransferase
MEFGNVASIQRQRADRGHGDCGVTILAETDAKVDAKPPVDDVIARLRDLRRLSQRRRYRGGAPNLPSRKIVIGAIDDLVAALYPRHFGPQSLSATALDAFIGETLHSATRALEGQIRLELALAGEGVGAAAAEPWRVSEIAGAFLTALPTIRALTDSDARAGYEGDPSAASIDEVIFSFPGFAAVLRHRLAHQLYALGAPMLARIASEEAHGRTGVDIHPGAQIGERFFIDHGTGVVIGETAIIGRNVRLYQGVTLGAKRFETEDATGALRKAYPRHPIVEDDVVIYAGATILGRITIGRGSSIGGAVWLTHSVPVGSHITQAKPRHETFDDGAGI